MLILSPPSSTLTSRSHDGFDSLPVAKSKTGCRPQASMQSLLLAIELCRLISVIPRTGKISSAFRSTAAER